VGECDCKQLKDKVALVTGAAQGLGEAIATRLAGEGMRVSLADIAGQFDKTSAVAARLTEQYGVKTLALRVDVTKEDEVSTGVDKTVAELGNLDLLVSNAGILQSAEITEFDAAVWRKVIDVNLVGYFLCAKHAARVMIPNKAGAIIQINSKSGKKGSFRNSAYAASKFGGIGLTQSLALELAPYNIRVNAICPGNLLDSPLWVDSLYEQYAKKWGITVEEVRRKYAEQVPLGRGCSYDDITNVLVFLASDAANYMTGQAINVTGGQQMD
jgi:sorbitol-6-phosphate 2-dehydrogenase